ncbi:putative esterase [Agrobacterium larrymoorei]|uniref:Esterase n=1 Tax=Agrobacterium larrymoorei TaxID=160699 RepID=A0ABU0UKY4_9HYPH|nr:putative esterase [Agrobacterium larrymoorei]
MALAHRANPNATLLGVRGRSTEEDVARWFRRFGDLNFDQKDIASEAEAFAAFLEGATQSYGIDRATLSFIGHSNGANFLAAFFALHPEWAADALLLRPMQVLEHWPAVDFGSKRFLLAAGETDRHRDKAHALAGILKGSGAEVEVRILPNNHDLGFEDVELAKEWVTARNVQ